jgi:hypothetical protein
MHEVAGHADRGLSKTELVAGGRLAAEIRGGACIARWLSVGCVIDADLGKISDRRDRTAPSSRNRPDLVVSRDLGDVPDAHVVTALFRSRPVKGFLLLLAQLGQQDCVRIIKFWYQRLRFSCPGSRGAERNRFAPTQGEDRRLHRLVSADVSLRDYARVALRPERRRERHCCTECYRQCFVFDLHIRHSQARVSKVNAY